MKINRTDCIVVHGCPSDSSEEKTKEYAKHWMPWIKKKLILKGIKTEIPLMPEPWHPDYEAFKKEFEKYKVTNNTILISHSCGCAFLVRWLGETKQKIKKLILVAPWKTYDGKDKFRKLFYGYTVDKTIKERVKNITMFTSDNDGPGSKKSLRIFHQALGGKIIELKGKGHYTLEDMGTEKFPELLEQLIQAIMIRSKQKIKFIYFDVGGVVILDYSKTNKWNEMLEDLGVSEEMKPMFNQLFEKHEHKICVGEDINIFIEETTKNLGFTFPSNYNMAQDFVNRFEINKSISKLIKKLKGEFKIGLLTNQYPNMLDMITKKGLMPKVKWNVVIDSSVEKMRKPNLEIYLLAENEARVNPESILFVDNKSNLLKVAKQRKWITFEYDPSNPEASTTKLQKFIYKHK